MHLAVHAWQMTDADDQPSGNERGLEIEACRNWRRMSHRMAALRRSSSRKPSPPSAQPVTRLMILQRRLERVEIRIFSVVLSPSPPGPRQLNTSPASNAEAAKKALQAA